jgi:acyl-coenzyme A synthetase/AMP-(fatty) acid ligase
MISFWQSIAPSGAAVTSEFHGKDASFAVADLATHGILSAHLNSLLGRSILIATKEQLPTAIALIELDGVARRMVLCTPDLTPEQLAGVAAAAGADAIVVDQASEPKAPPGLTIFRVDGTPGAAAPDPAVRSLNVRGGGTATEWILLTSGTTGTPKLVVHTLESLGGALPRQPPSASRVVWSTFYDIRRYGGLQIYLRAVLSGLPLVLSCSGESTAEFLARAGAHGVTHISGTPSHWRRALISGSASQLKPEYLRLSGEIADQPVLDSLRAAFPNARIGHAFASTEAGVAFDVNDGLAGFPADLMGENPGQIAMKVEGGTLRIRSGRNAARYLGSTENSLAGADGYVDTGDLVELVDGRYYFRGRKGGIINVGGLKVYPEEVESVLNADPRVRMSLVRARRNPITGAIVVADVVAADPARLAADAAGAESLKSDLLDACRRALPAHKIPAMLRFVPALELTAAGKLVRPVA